ncbi:MAG: hypothetical protein ABEJ24_02605 [Candidatus Magasanikbacteria bacterium]
MKQKTKPKITQEDIERAVEGSSNLEGLSLKEAKKDKKAVELLKKHGKYFQVQSE